MIYKSWQNSEQNFEVFMKYISHGMVNVAIPREFLC